uniref:Lectin-like protein EP153R n=1 Tax=African swine fever virus TaxID=10497 RepID=O89337_ASF|nr:lectin homolog [African swine fever virus]
MFSNKKYPSLIEKKMDDLMTLKFCYIIIAILIMTNIFSLVVNIWGGGDRQSYENVFYCPKDWVGYNNACYYFSNDMKNYTEASNYCKNLYNSTIVNNNTNIVNLTKTLNLTKIYNHESNYWVNYSLINNESLTLRDSNFPSSGKRTYIDLLYICSI